MEMREEAMKRRSWLVGGRILLIAGMATSYAAKAAFELTAPNGRRVLLKDNGTWAYVETQDKNRADDKGKQQGELLLTLERKIERDSNCQFGLQLVNNMPYEVNSLVLYYSAYRTNGTLYDTVSAGTQFGTLKPGSRQSRQIQFTGIACQDIARVQVGGGDRCDMGDLGRWSDQS